MVPLSDDAAALIPGLWDLRAGDRSTQVAARVLAEYGDDTYAWDGYVDRAEASLDEETRTIEVVVLVPRPFAGGARQETEAGEPEEESSGPPLLVGKFVEVELQGVAPDRYFKVRRPALRPGNEIWTVRGGSVAIVPVQVLQRSDDGVFVTGGLEGGEPTIVSGIQLATEGMEVRAE